MKRIVGRRKGADTHHIVVFEKTDTPTFYTTPPTHPICTRSTYNVGTRCLASFLHHPTGIVPEPIVVGIRGGGNITETAERGAG